LAATEQREVVGFGRAAGEDDLVRCGVDQGGEVLPRLPDGSPRLLPDRVDDDGLPKSSWQKRPDRRGDFRGNRTVVAL